jgi:hypothetical protein
MIPNLSRWAAESLQIENFILENFILENFILENFILENFIFLKIERFSKDI